jgi:molecular chaperone DnaK
MARDNRSIGKFILDGIPPAPRAVPQIEVSFDIDANGILHVSAKDKGTGKEQKIRIEASTGLSQDEIDRMKKEAEANADADKMERENIDKLNTADSLIFQTEKQMKEYGDKVPADKKEAIESALAELKDAHKMQDLSKIDSATAKLNEAWQAASQDMYQGTQGQEAQAGANQGTTDENNTGDNKGSDDVTDVDYEEVS